MDKLELLQNVNFGERVAEDERAELASYFVETDQWNRVYRGEADIVYGPKGSGKSAIYALLLARKSSLATKNICVISAENPTGTTVFKSINQPGKIEFGDENFRELWKLYFACLIANELKRRELDDDDSVNLRLHLMEAELLPDEWSLQRVLTGVWNFFRKITNISSVEGNVNVDSKTNEVKGIGGKISFAEPSATQRSQGFVSVDDLLQWANAALARAGIRVWILLDRLDVAFSASSEIERIALRALFRAYIDMRSLENVFLKIFIRTDIWKQISVGGFRESSHITRSVSIEWRNNSLMNLIIRRALKNPALAEYLNADTSAILSNIENQYNLFYRMFPRQVYGGQKKAATFDWMLTRTTDSSSKPVPRELLHLLSASVRTQIEQLESGEAAPPDEQLCTANALRAALPSVSKVKLEQTLYAEYPDYKPYIEKLDGEKTEQYLESLTKIWAVDLQEATLRAHQLVEIGFFERRGTKEQPSFWVPFIYRPQLNLVQGSALPTESNPAAQDEDE